MCRLRNIAMHDYQESMTTGQTDRCRTKVIPMCRYASQATQKIDIYLHHVFIHALKLYLSSFTGIFQGCFGGRMLAPFPMEKVPIFSQRVDEISKSETSQSFSNFSSLINEYFEHSKMTISGL